MPQRVTGAGVPGQPGLGQLTAWSRLKVAWRSRVALKSSSFLAGALVMGKGWGKRSKGRSKNKKHRDAADAAAAAAELAELARKRKRTGGTDGSASKRHKHVPQKLGRGGHRQKLDVKQLDSPSRKVFPRCATCPSCSSRCRYAQHASLW